MNTVLDGDIVWSLAANCMSPVDLPTEGASKRKCGCVTLRNGSTFVARANWAKASIHEPVARANSRGGCLPISIGVPREVPCDSRFINGQPRQCRNICSRWGLLAADVRGTTLSSGGKGVDLQDGSTIRDVTQRASHVPLSQNLSHNSTRFNTR